MRYCDKEVVDDDMKMLIIATIIIITVANVMMIFLNKCDVDKANGIAKTVAIEVFKESFKILKLSTV